MPTWQDSLFLMVLFLLVPMSALTSLEVEMMGM